MVADKGMVWTVFDGLINAAATLTNLTTSMFHYKGKAIQDKGMGRSSFFCDGQLRHNQELGKVTVKTSQES